MCAHRKRFDRQFRRPDEPETVLRRFVRRLGREPRGPGRAAVHRVLPAATPRRRRPLVRRVGTDDGRGTRGDRRPVPPPVQDRFAATATVPPVRVRFTRRRRRRRRDVGRGDGPGRDGQTSPPPAAAVAVVADTATTTAPPDGHDQPTAHRTHVADNETTESSARTHDPVPARHDASKSSSTYISAFCIPLLFEPPHSSCIPLCPFKRYPAGCTVVRRVNTRCSDLVLLSIAECKLAMNSPKTIYTTVLDLS